MNRKFVVIEMNRDMSKIARARHYFDSHDDALIYKMQVEDKERFAIIEVVTPYFKPREDEEEPEKYEKLIYFALSLGAVIGFISIIALTWTCIRLLWSLV